MKTSTFVPMIRGLEFLSPDSFRLAGDVYRLSDDGDAGTTKPAIVDLLEGALYSKLYTRSRPPAVQTGQTLQREFLARLSAANVGRGAFDDGWTVTQIEADGTIAASKDGLTVWASPDDCQWDGDAPSPGARIRVCVGREQRQLVPGFYFAFCNNAPPHDSAVLRLYWNVTAAGAPPLVRAVTHGLNESNIAFRFKTLNEPHLYARADAAVLYMATDDYARARTVLRKIVTSVSSWLGSDIPLMTKRLATGVGLAEDPGTAQVSFGQHRCRLVAEAAWQSYQAERTSEEQRLDDVAAAFVAHGLDPSRPYLQPGSIDRYPALEHSHAARAARTR